MRGDEVVAVDHQVEIALAEAGKPRDPGVRVVGVSDRPFGVGKRVHKDGGALVDPAAERPQPAYGRDLTVMLKLARAAFAL